VKLLSAIVSDVFNALVCLHVLAVNASYLGKNGAVTILFKVLALCQRKHLILLKHSLDTLGHLVKSSQCHSVSLSLSLVLASLVLLGLPLQNSQRTDRKQFANAFLLFLSYHISVLAIYGGLNCVL